MSCSKKWSIECKNLHFLPGAIKVHQKNNLFYLPDSIILKKKDKANEPPDKAKAYFSNFNFSEANKKSEFTINTNNKNIQFNMLDESNQLLELIDIKRISNAILSEAIIPINQNENIQSIEAEIKSISWFLSFLNLDTNVVPVVEYLSNNDIVQYSIKNTTKKNSGKKYIIDNNRIQQGIPIAFNQCYVNYQHWQNQININVLIDYLAEINRQEYIDLKLSNMIMAYEYFVTKYLINQDMLPETQANKSIQEKLTSLNTKLKFIPSNMINGHLRSSVRKPLFHQGEIASMTTKDKIDTFKKYYDLLIKIVLRVLNYTGKYISIENNSLINV